MEAEPTRDLNRCWILTLGTRILDGVCFVEDDAVEVEVEQWAEILGPQLLALH